MSTASRGAAREHQVKRLLEDEGWAVTRGAGSHGCADLWAARGWDHTAILQHALGLANIPREFTELRLVQVKTDKRGPFANFSPLERLELRTLAAQTGGTAELCWWPARKPCRWLGVDEWPEVKVAA